MENPIGNIIMLFTLLTTYNGFIKQVYFDRYLFNVDKILIGREWYRLFSSGFLHANWIHFGFNMLALVSFSLSLERTLGYIPFIGLYFASMLGGSLLALYIHRNHGDYTAIGASGAISGVVMSSVVLFPDNAIQILLIPIDIPSWIFGLLFILISLFGIKSQTGNIGHEAHLGGAITGLLLTLLIKPTVAIANWWVIVLMLVPILVFLWIVVYQPDVLITGKFRKPELKIRHSNARTENKNDGATKPRSSNEMTLDDILDKIKRKGMDSLTKRERQELEKWSDKI